MIGTFGGVMTETCCQHAELVKDLKTNVFPSREIKFLAMGRDGKKEVRVA